MASRNSQQESISLDTLTPQQLTAVKKQLDEEVEHLSASYSQLAAAQAKFKECLRVVQTGSVGFDREKDILVPLTNSLYVKGKLADPEHVIVDVGTGFFVEKDTKAASEFYEAKVGELEANIKDIEAIVQNKTNSLRVVEEVLRQKVLVSGAGGPQAQAQAA
ncbi:putative prefoldin subunit 5 [Schizothecium vesticola]|uniref:Prefoldin subunit 5 n=1 Tax=Schizothecium vesticola TaxID=314040 RepID=A0AA40KCL3_9PEZI|nr:putative prefoldin subunit 5 [Schizothecium vesticola]